MWGLTGRGLGRSASFANQDVFAHLQTILPGSTADVIVGASDGKDATTRHPTTRHVRDILPESEPAHSLLDHAVGLLVVRPLAQTTMC